MLNSSLTIMMLVVIMALLWCPSSMSLGLISSLSTTRWPFLRTTRAYSNPRVDLFYLQASSSSSTQQKQQEKQKQSPNLNQQSSRSRSITPIRTSRSSSSSSSSTSTNLSTRDAAVTSLPSQQSPRLLKARLLLERLTDDTTATAMSGSVSSPLSRPQQDASTSDIDPTKSPAGRWGVGMTPNSTAVTKSLSSPSTSQTTSLIASEFISNVNNNNNIIVLDDTTIWRNGHLQGGNDVTRWAAGVRVAQPLQKYDPVAAQKQLFRQPTKWVIRNFQIAFTLGWWVFNVVLDYVFGEVLLLNKRPGGVDEESLITQQRRRQRARELCQAISSLGPAIIKGGQALASRPDLLPSEYLEELQKLQDDVPRFSNAIAMATVEEELEIPFDQVFELVLTEPIAAASIGQVYKARLKETGDLVALKIQRPNCEAIIALDLYILRWWGGVYNRLFQIFQRDINLQSVIDDFGELIYREIDYIAEMANAQRFNELYAGVRDVFVPKVYSQYTTSKVITMEWVDGFRLTDRASLKRYALDESKLVKTLVQCSLRQILENGFFHADPHAGNLLACPDGRLCYLDFGMMSYAARHQRNGFLLAVVHIVNRDWPELARLYQRLGFIPANTDLRPIAVALENALPDVLNADISELNFKNVINKLGDIMYTFPFSLPPFYIAIIRCLGVLEGLAIQVDPKARIISEAYPYIASRVLTDPQDELQEALRRLALTSDGQIRWDRLEGLLDKAKGSAGYDVTAALDVLTEYLISSEADKLWTEISEQIVEAADSLGTETAAYLLEATRALAINDEVAAVRAFRSLQEVVQSRSQGGTDGMRKRIGEDLRDVLPEPTPSMRRFGTILSLVGASSGQTDPSRFVPIVRKLAQDSRVQSAANEILARLGERLLSRGLRAAFGLPPPSFGRASDYSTVTEDRG